MKRTSLFSPPFVKTQVKELIAPHGVDLSDAKTAKSYVESLNNNMDYYDVDMSEAVVIGPRKSLFMNFVYDDRPTPFPRSHQLLCTTGLTSCHGICAIGYTRDNKRVIGMTHILFEGAEELKTFYNMMTACGARADASLQMYLFGSQPQFESRGELLEFKRARLNVYPMNEDSDETLGLDNITCLYIRPNGNIEYALLKGVAPYHLIFAREEMGSETLTMPTK